MDSTPTRTSWCSGIQEGSARGLLSRRRVERVDTIRDPDSGQALARHPADAVRAVAESRRRTQLRLHQARIITTINKHMGESLVENIRTLPVGPSARPTPAAGSGPLPAPRPPQQPTNHGPLPRNPAYLATLAVAREHRPNPIVHPDLTRVIDAQTEALLRNREPETAFAEAVYQQDQARALQEAMGGHTSLEASLRAARRRTRAEASGSASGPPHASPLRNTA